MVTTLNDTKRLAIAERLADLKAFQNLIISNEQKLIDACPYEDVRDRLQNMLADDQKNIGIIDTVIVQYGIQSEPSAATKIFIPQFEQMMSGDEFTFYQKLIHHELMKHGQAMSGIMIHKAAQVVGADIEVAITPLNTVSFEGRAHQEQLKGMLEQVGVREMTGLDAQQGLWARVQDAVGALTGVVGSVVTRTNDEISIRDLLLADHTKADTLFGEILSTDDPQKRQEYFGQLYRDLKVHGTAEEEVVYPAIRPHYEHTQEIYEQTEEVMQMLDEIKPLNPSSSEFKAKVDQLRTAVRTHINQEEKDIFPQLKHDFSDEQQKQMATDFKTAKSKLQKQFAPS
jgi:hemerythrin superfamily protein